VTRQQHAGFPERPERQVDTDRVDPGVPEQAQIVGRSAACVQHQITAARQRGEASDVGDRTTQAQRLLVGPCVLVVRRHAPQRALVQLHARSCSGPDRSDPVRPRPPMLVTVPKPGPASRASHAPTTSLDVIGQLERRVEARDLQYRADPVVGGGEDQPATMQPGAP
jgi:hypothetical protein